jgi:long-chain acyl-CoA synthetase
MRTRLHADPAGIFLHDAILSVCQKFASHTAIVDTSFAAGGITYAQYGKLVEDLGRGMVAAGVEPGEVIAIYLPNCWEFAASYHAATLAGAIPTPLNPSYREREVRYQLENSEAVVLITDAALISSMNLRGLPKLRKIYTTRLHCPGTEPLSNLLQPTTAGLPRADKSEKETIAALPYSSGTTGLPKGVILTHSNLVTNVYQFLAPGETATFIPSEVILCFLPLYHIYGLNVVLNSALMVGATLVLMPRFDLLRVLTVIEQHQVSFVPLVPPVLNAFCLAAEQGTFPQSHRIRAVKCGAAPLPPELPRRFTSLTGIPIRQGYGMTEASPVTHIGFIEEHLYAPEFIGPPVALTDCRLVLETGEETSQTGELVMRGPQFMPGYWKAPEATREALREGWYWSGDVASKDERGFFQIVDRRKEMIKYKGFPIAPAEVEAVMLEHPQVKDCGVVGRKDTAAGEIACAFVVLREGASENGRLAEELCGYVGERLTSYKQPREIRFVSTIPRTPSGKILRRELREML